MDYIKNYNEATNNNMPIQQIRQVYHEGKNNSINLKEDSFVICDYQCNQMLFLKRSLASEQELAGTYCGGYTMTQNTKIGNAIKHRSIPISSGIAQLIKIENRSDLNNNIISSELVFELFCNGKIIYCKINNENFMKDSKLVKNQIEENGVFFIDGGYKKWRDFVLKNICNIQQYCIYEGFYIDNSKNLCHINQSDIMKTAPETNVILQMLDIDFENGCKYYLFQNLTLFINGLLGQTFSLFKNEYLENPIIPTWVSNSPQITSNAIDRLYHKEICSISLENGFEERLIEPKNDVVILTVCGLSEYLLKKQLSKLTYICNNSNKTKINVLPILVTNATVMNIGNSNLLFIPFAETKIKNLDGVIKWAIFQILKDNNIVQTIKSLYTNYSDTLANEIEKPEYKNFFALLLAIAEVYLHKLDFKVYKIKPIIAQYKEYLMNCIQSSDYIIIEQLKKYLLSLRDIALHNIKECERFNQDEICLYTSVKGIEANSKTMEYIANKLAVPLVLLKNNLKEHNLLNIDNTSEYQRNVTLDNGLKGRMYSIKNELYDVGKIRPHCNMQSDTKPLIKLQFGQTDSTEIVSYNIGLSDGTIINNFAYVLGKSGYGKSNFLMVLAKAASENGLSVVSISDKQAGLKLGEGISKQFCCDEYSISNIEWDEVCEKGKISQVIIDTDFEDNEYSTLNKALESFYKYKSNQENIQYTLLILDEVQQFSWNTKSPLVKYILRQGRKFGIVGILSSQFINADNGRNFASALRQIDTIFAFNSTYNDIDTLKRLGFNADNEKAKELISELEIGELVAYGNISVENCNINYQLKVKVDKYE